MSQKYYKIQFRVEATAFALVKASSHDDAMYKFLHREIPAVTVDSKAGYERMIDSTKPTDEHYQVSIGNESEFYTQAGKPAH